MLSDTKFPETIQDRMYNDKEMTDKVPNPYKEWMKRCMADYPKPDLGTYRDNLSGEPYPWYFLEPMQEWYEKWFGQFKEYHLGVDYAKPNIDYSVMPPEITMCHICGGKWLSQMSVYCPHCAKEKEEPKESKTAIPIAVTHYRCPHCNAVDSMLVQKLEDKKGVCIECFKEMEMEGETE